MTLARISAAVRGLTSGISVSPYTELSVLDLGGVIGSDFELATVADLMAVFNGGNDWHLFILFVTVNDLGAAHSFGFVVLGSSFGTSLGALVHAQLLAAASSSVKFERVVGGACEGGGGANGGRGGANIGMGGA